MGFEARAAARASLNKALIGEKSFTEELTIDHFMQAVENPSQEGIVALSTSWKSWGLNVTNSAARQGVEFFSKHALIMRRQILKKVAFPPERQLVEETLHENTIWSVPVGWTKWTPDCTCMLCTYQRVP